MADEAALAGPKARAPPWTRWGREAPDPRYFLSLDGGEIVLVKDFDACGATAYAHHPFASNLH